DAVKQVPAVVVQLQGARVARAAGRRGHPHHRIAGSKAGDAFAHRFHDAGRLVPQGTGHGQLGMSPPVRLEIRAAGQRRANPHQHLARAGRGLWQLPKGEGTDPCQIRLLHHVTSLANIKACRSTASRRPTLPPPRGENLPPRPGARGAPAPHNAHDVSPSRSCTIRPPQRVRSTWVCSSWSGSALKMSWDSTATSANAPGPRVPLRVSSKVAYAL